VEKFTQKKGMCFKNTVFSPRMKVILVFIMVHFTYSSSSYIFLYVACVCVCIQLLDNSILKEYHEAVFILLYALQSDIYISSCFCFYSVVDIHLYSKKQKILLFSFLTKRREFFLSFFFCL